MVVNILAKHWRITFLVGNNIIVQKGVFANATVQVVHTQVHPLNSYEIILQMKGSML